MSTLRRSLVLAALTIGVVVSAIAVTLPAQASFADSVTTTTTYGTADVAAPGNIVPRLTCGNPNSTMGMTWQLSSTPRVSGYLVTVYFSDGFTQTVQMGATATSWSQSISTFNVVNWSIQYSVTTQTDYGWTKESARTGWFHC
jgi:hypothetical protein